MGRRQAKLTGLAAQPFADVPFWFSALISKPIAEFAWREAGKADLTTWRQSGLLLQATNLIDRMAFAAGKDISYGFQYGAAVETGKNPAPVFPSSAGSGFRSQCNKTRVRIVGTDYSHSGFGHPPTPTFAGMLLVYLL